MATPAISEYLKFVNLQMAAEALYDSDATRGLPLKPGKPYVGALLEENLTTGNRHASKFTATQAAEFVTQWEVVEHISNTKTGFSGTLLKAIKDDPATGTKAGEYVISFRSTEFLDDAGRDNQATNTLEIKEKGWAFGQIDDMEGWYAHLTGSGLLPAGQKFSVTGYSLGGHLATAFNILRAQDGTQGRIDKVVTFNGAGVGNITEGSLRSVMEDFRKLRASPEEVDKRISDATLRSLVGEIRNKLESNTWTIARAKDQVNNLAANSESAGLTPEQLMVWKALDRMQTIITEATDVTKLSSGVEDKTTPKNPAEIPISQIEQATFNYQMAVLLTAKKTEAVGLKDGLIQTFTESQISPNKFDNQFDVQGATLPSLVSNSQVHFGTPVGVFIENQPLWRGDYIGDPS